MHYDEILSIIDNAYEDARLLAEQKLFNMSFDMTHICFQTLLVLVKRREIDLDELAVRINSLCIDYIWSYLQTPENETLQLIRTEIKDILSLLNSL